MKGLLNEAHRLQKLAGIFEGQYGSDTGAQELYPLMDDLSSLISTNSNLSTADKEAIFPILSKMTSIVDAIVADGDFYDDNYEESVSDYLQEAGAKKRSKKKSGPGLWANIRKQREDGEKPAHPNSKEYKDAVKAGKEINKNK
jgi:hypothetical protein